MFNKLKKWKGILIDEVYDLTEYIDREVNRVKSEQGQYNKEFRDKLGELKDGELEDLKLMEKMSNKIIKLEDDLMFTKGNLESWKLQSRENMMLLMEHLGVYLDYEDDKKVIKKESIPKKRK